MIDFFTENIKTFLQNIVISRNKLEIKQFLLSLVLKGNRFSKKYLKELSTSSEMHWKIISLILSI